MGKQEFGAGIWHFATYLDRYATDGYGEPRSVLDAIELAGQVKDLSYVDLNFPYFGGSYSNKQIKDALDKANLKVIGITPEIYTREFSKGAFTNPDPGVRKRAHELITQSCEAVRFFDAKYVKLWPGQDGWDYPFQPANSGPRRGNGRRKIGAKGSPGGAAGSFKLRTTHRE